MALKKLGGGQGLVKAGMLGFQGSGKTYTAILLAAAIRKQFGLKGPIGLIDSENATAYVAPLAQELTGLELVGDRTRDFDQLVSLGHDCVKEGVSVLVADSMTHFWRNLCDAYLAGINENNSRRNRAPRSRLEFADWGPLKSQWAKWTDFYLNSPLHIIICGRAGYEYDMTKNEETGRNELNKTGIKMKTEGEFGFEPSLLVQMEVEQEPVKEGGFRQIRTATILKDRFGVIDGAVFQFRKGKDHAEEMQAVANAFGPHLALLRPGVHSQVPTAINPMPVSDEGDIEWTRERKARTILCEEIQGAIIEKYPGQSADDKKAKAGVMAQYFGTRSWTAIEGMNSDKLRDGLFLLKQGLGIDVAEPAKPADPDDDVPMGKPQEASKAVPAPQGAPEASTPQEPAKPATGTTPKAEVTPLKMVQFLLGETKPKVSAAQILNTMHSVGSLEDPDTTLEELSMTSAHTLTLLMEQFASFHKAACELHNLK